MAPAADGETFTTQEHYQFVVSSEWHNLLLVVSATELGNPLKGSPMSLMV